MSDAQPNDVVARQSNAGRSPALAPLIGYVLIVLVAAVLVPPVPPAADAGPTEAWVTFGLANALIFGIVFGVLLLLFWVIDRIVTRRSSVSSHVGGAALVSTILMLLAVAAQWYGRQP